jgi:energy-coupling factor transporter ATP-binding protein EcfA2
MSLRPIDSTEIHIPAEAGSERFVQFVTDGNLIDLRERMSVNRGRELEAAVFVIRSISLDKKVSCGIDIVFNNGADQYFASHKQTFALPGRLLAVNFRENEKYGYKKTSRHLDIKKALHILKSNETGAFLEVETYPYLQQNAYLDLVSYDFDKHSFIVGASGSGKSKMIGLMVDRLLKSPMASQYRIVVIDPHASLEEDLRDLPGANVLNFRSNEASTGLFAEGNTDISASTELTVTLFQSLLGSHYIPELERVLRYSLTVLMTAQVMTLQNLRRFLTDESYRISVLSHVQAYIPASAASYFANEYAIAQAQKHAEVLLPILELIDEIDLRAHASGAEQASSLAHVVGENPLTVFFRNISG